MMDVCWEEVYFVVKGLNLSLISFEFMNIGVVGIFYIVYNIFLWQGWVVGLYFKVIFDIMIENVLKVYIWFYDSIVKLIIDFDNFV